MDNFYARFYGIRRMWLCSKTVVRYVSPIMWSLNGRPGGNLRSRVLTHIRTWCQGMPRSVSHIVEHRSHQYIDSYRISGFRKRLDALLTFQPLPHSLIPSSLCIAAAHFECDAYPSCSCSLLIQLVAMSVFVFGKSLPFLTTCCLRGMWVLSTDTSSGLSGTLFEAHEHAHDMLEL